MAPQKVMGRPAVMAFCMVSTAAAGNIPFSAFIPPQTRSRAPNLQVECADALALTVGFLVGLRRRLWLLGAIAWWSFSDGVGA